MPHSQARNGIKFTNGLQLQTVRMSAWCDMMLQTRKIFVDACVQFMTGSVNRPLALHGLTS
jgi:hypothetical protein